MTKKTFAAMVIRTEVFKRSTHTYYYNTLYYDNIDDVLAAIQRERLTAPDNSIAKIVIWCKPKNPSLWSHDTPPFLGVETYNII
jgi:hypothetical protein